MRSISSALTLLVLALAALPATPGSTAGQLLDLQTAPLAAGDQFFVAPSRNAGMASPSIALGDPLLDPFVNPAKGSRLAESQLVTSPTTYGISNQHGGAQTLPIGALLTSNRWFGGVAAAMQQIDRGGARWSPTWSMIPIDPRSNVVLPSSDWMSRSPTNKYFQLVVGRRVGDSGLALAASAQLADLNGTDGVEDLFANAWEISEFGDVQDYRVGIVGTLSGDRTFEAVLVHNRVDLGQDVTTVDLTLTDSVNGLWTPEVQHEANRNRTRTWGAHLGYVQPIGDSDWRFGGALTVNRKLHPEIPTYDLAAVQFPFAILLPRDPGESWATSLGFGVARQVGPTSFAMDIAYEPAVSDTWGDAAADTVLADGTTLLAGGHTVDNRFVFSNARLAAGFSHDVGQGALQLGVRARHVDYRLEQDDHVRQIRRTQTEQWTEWTPTWGFRYTWTGVELRYTGSASSASHFPWLWRNESLLEVDQPITISQDVLAPPRGRLRIPDETVVTHRLSVSVPVR